MPDGYELDWAPRQSRTLSARIVNAIREAIIRGDLPPGQPLKQAELARRFRVSQAPLREALRQLEVEGFVRLVARRHAIVPPLDAEELRDFSDIASVLEGLAVREAVPNLTPAVFAEAERLHAELAAEKDLANWLPLVLRLRLTLYAPCGRHRLLGIIRLVRLNTHRYARALYQSQAGHEVTLWVMRELIEVCRRGDPEAAARFVEDSYSRARDVLLHEMATGNNEFSSLLPGGPTPVRPLKKARRRNVATAMARPKG